MYLLIDLRVPDCWVEGFMERGPKLWVHPQLCPRSSNFNENVGWDKVTLDQNGNFGLGDSLDHTDNILYRFKYSGTSYWLWASYLSIMLWTCFSITPNFIWAFTKDSSIIYLQRLFCYVVLITALILDRMSLLTVLVLHYKLASIGPYSIKGFNRLHYEISLQDVRSLMMS